MSVCVYQDNGRDCRWRTRGVDNASYGDYNEPLGSVEECRAGMMLIIRRMSKAFCFIAVLFCSPESPVGTVLFCRFYDCGIFVRWADPGGTVCCNYEIVTCTSNCLDYTLVVYSVNASLRRLQDANWCFVTVIQGARRNVPAASAGTSMVGNSLINMANCVSE